MGSLINARMRHTGYATSLASIDKYHQTTNQSARLCTLTDQPIRWRIFSAVPTTYSSTTRYLTQASFIRHSPLWDWSYFLLSSNLVVERCSLFVLVMMYEDSKILVSLDTTQNYISTVLNRHCNEALGHYVI